MKKASREDEHQDLASSSGELTRPLDIIAYVAGRTFVPLKADLPGELSDAVEWSVRYVTTNFIYNITLDDMAQAAGLSKYHFLRKFRQEAGMTPGAFLQRFRIAAAMKELTDSKQPVRDIAKRVGYRDPAAFSRAFSKIAGVQPRRFRQEQQSGAEPSAGGNG